MKGVSLVPPNGTENTIDSQLGAIHDVCALKIWPSGTLLMIVHNVRLQRNVFNLQKPQMTKNARKMSVNTILLGICGSIFWVG